MSTAIHPDALYHLATPQQWTEHRARGAIVPPSLDLEGFVHCSWGRQVDRTVATHFAGVADLLALRVDEDSVRAALVVEDSYGSGQAFPHVYGPIPVAAVTEVVELRP